MTAFTLYDFTESLERASITDAKRVVAAWGENGDCSEWSGGFLIEREGGGYVYLTGWCDTTGWGCQDGISTADFTSQPDLGSLPRTADEPNSGTVSPVDWDTEAKDLNAFLNKRIDQHSQPI